MPTNNQTTRSRERNPIPSCIVTALSKQQDKLYILHLERDLIKFIKNSILGNIKQPEYIIQAQYLKNSYYRLLSHQLCHYYCLQHWNNTFNEIRVTPTLNFNYQEFVQKIESSEDKEVGEFVKISSIAHKYTTDNEPSVKPEPVQKKKLLVKHLHEELPNTPESPSSECPVSESSENTGSIESERENKILLYMKLREEIFDNDEEDEEDEEDEDEDEEEQEVQKENKSNYIDRIELERRILNNPYIIIPGDRR